MSILQFAEQPPVSWARFGRFGEGGSYGYQIDASGLDVRNRMMHKELVPATADAALQTRIRVKSSLVTNNPAFEGLAIRHRGFQLEGLTPGGSDVQKWDSQPESQGKRAWISEQNSEFTTYNFVNDLPPNLGIDYATWEVEVRAQSGQVNIDDVQCRYYYGRYYPDLTIYGSQTMLTAAFSEETVAPDIDGKPIKRWVSYQKTIAVEMNKGQVLNSSAIGAFIGVMKGLGASVPEQNVPTYAGWMIKLRRRGTGTYDYFDVVNRYSNNPPQAHKYDGESRQLILKHAYDQAELVAFLEPDPFSGIDSVSARSFTYRDPELDLTVADFVAPSQ